MDFSSRQVLEKRLESKRSGSVYQIEQRRTFLGSSLTLGENTMRRIFWILILSAGSLEAQQSTAHSRKLVERAYDPSTDIVVMLLGEDKGRPTKNGLRTADPSASRCVGRVSTRSTAARVAATASSVHNPTLELPLGWRQMSSTPIPLNGNVVRGSQLVAKIVGRSELPSASQPRAYVSFSSEEGYPNVALQRGSEVVSEAECVDALSSAQAAHIIRATAKTPDRGMLSYVLGYGKVSDTLWVTYLASSSDAADVDDLVELFRSLAVEE